MPRTPPGTYQYPIADCDVQNQSLLIEYRKKRSEWVDWLLLDEHHNIWDQFNELVWNDAIYRAVNESRRLATEASPSSALNGLVGAFINSGYIATQILSIARLTDRLQSTNAKKGIISLRRLVDDVGAHKRLITRENYVCYDGLPYDYEKVRHEFFDSQVKPNKAQFFALDNQGPMAFGNSERHHAAFDAISGTPPTRRTRNDLIDDRVLETLLDWLESPPIKKVRELRNKHVAHAADALSRSHSSLSAFGISMNELADAHKLLLRVMSAASTQILYESARGTVVPEPQDDQFIYLDLPFVNRTHLSDLRKSWSDNSEQRDEWLKERFNLISGKQLRGNS